ncbi:MAG: PAS domain-containing protein, partial [Dehalococcoidia bacterium]|nr:PAS domain-containing protein [Dehalococcoidia bacterium]
VGVVAVEDADAARRWDDVECAIVLGGAAAVGAALAAPTDSRTTVVNAEPSASANGPQAAVNGAGDTNAVTVPSGAVELGGSRERILSAVASIGVALLGAERWEPVLPRVLALIGEATSASRAYLFRHLDMPDGSVRWPLLYEWCAPGITPQIDNPEYLDYDPVACGYGDWVQRLRRGEVCWLNVRDLPPERRASLEAQDILTVIQAPVLVGDELWGCIGLDDCWAERAWSIGETSALSAAAATLGAAIRAERANQQLRASEELFRTLVNNVPGALYRCDLDSDWTMRSLSAAITDITGYDRDGFLNNRDRTFAEIIHPDDRAMVEAIVRQAVEERRGFEVEYRIIHKDGRVRWVWERGQAVIGAGGDVDALSGVIIDVSDAKRQQAALDTMVAELAASEARYRNVVANLPGAIYRARFDHHWSLSFVTAPIAEITGYSPEEFTSGAVHLADLILPEDKARCEPQTRAAIAARAQYSNEYRLRRRDGQVRWVLDQGLPVLDERGRVLYFDGMLFDITARKQAEA